jgi:mono/diheme cytochrome c family protein
MPDFCFRRRLLAQSGALALLLSGWSCGHAHGAVPGATTAAEPAKPSAKTEVVSPRIPTRAPEPPVSASIGDVMADHFMITSWARDSVIAGMLDPMREPLVVLASYRYDELPAGSWVPWMAQLQAAAQLTSQAETLDAAAMGVATMARVCGECHVANHGGPVIPPPPEKSASVAADSVGERMGRHMWGAELMWEGLTGPSETSWKAGAETLVQVPSELDDRLPESFDSALREVVSLGHTAHEATTFEARADVYGMLIATCAECHSRWIEHGDL